VHPATLYRWIERFEAEGKTSALLPTKREGGRGESRLAQEVEALTQVTLQQVYLPGQRLSARKAWEEVARGCRAAGLKAPHESTVRRRIARLCKRDALTARHGQRAAEALEAVPGEFSGADFPLAVVQIDHTKLDLVLVDEANRQAIGRPWLTLAIDVYSRIVAGYHISLDPPGMTSVALCLIHAILPKEVWLAGHNLDVKWPCWGLPTAVHADNAREFRGNALRRACEQYGIHLEWRPVKKPRYGAHIERLMGTLLQEIHTLAGTTFSSIKERGAYDSSARAALTLRELECWLAVHLGGVYHQREHAALNGSSPLHRYEAGILGDASRPGRGTPQRVADERRLLLDFLPYVERAIQRNGVVIDEIRYYDDVLAPHVSAPEPGRRGAPKRKFIFRRDPRDLSAVYFFDPETHDYHTIPYRNTSWPPVTIWELREARRALRAEKRRQLDAVTIFAAIERKRAIVEHAAPQPHRPLTKSAPAPPPEAEAVPRDVLPFDEVE
jgi:putative transposase